MRKTALIFIVSVLVGCGALRGLDVRVPKGVDLRSYRRLAVLSFYDERGYGGPFAEEMARGLWGLDYDVYTGRQLAGTLKEMGIGPGETIGMHDMIELRRMSHIDAVVTGDIDCRRGQRPRVSVIIQDARDSAPIFSITFEPDSCGTRRDIAPIVARVIAALSRKRAIYDSESRGEAPF